MPNILTGMVRIELIIPISGSYKYELIQVCLIIFLINRMRMQKPTFFLLLLSLLMVLTVSQYPPKGPKDAKLPITDIFSRNTARNGNTDFWKVDQNSYTTLISTYPVRTNAITKVTVYLVYGIRIAIGCGQGYMSSVLQTGCVGVMPNTVCYYNQDGKKWKDGDASEYGSTSIAGDKITMTIDTRPEEYSVSFAKNGLDMGVAYSGMNNWNTPIYIMFSLHNAGDRIKIINYEVEDFSQ